VFLVNHSFTTRVGFGKRVRSPARRPSRHRRDQKTFSAGPRSFSSKELWFPERMTASGVQPVCDSRHGRIACKVSLSCTNSKCKENRRLQSVHRALSPTRLLADGGSQNSTRLHRLVCQFRKHSFLVIVALLGHHVPRRFSQLAPQGFGGDDLARFGGLAVVPAPTRLRPQVTDAISLA
jgi:hypothetical protein